MSCLGCSAIARQWINKGPNANPSLLANLPASGSKQFKVFVAVSSKLWEALGIRVYQLAFWVGRCMELNDALALGRQRKLVSRVCMTCSLEAMVGPSQRLASRTRVSTNKSHPVLWHGQ
eukprot:4134471-Amphidinium_carterae.1